MPHRDCALPEINEQLDQIWKAIVNKASHNDLLIPLDFKLDWDCIKGRLQQGMSWTGYDCYIVWYGLQKRRLDVESTPVALTTWRMTWRTHA
jgi:hypothetical protein